VESERHRLDELVATVDAAMRDLRAAQADEKARASREAKRSEELRAQFEAERKAAYERLSEELRRGDEERRERLLARERELAEVAAEKRSVMELREVLILEQQKSTRAELEAKRGVAQELARLEGERRGREEERDALVSLREEVADARAKLEEEMRRVKIERGEVEREGARVSGLAKEVEAKAVDFARSREQAREWKEEGLAARAEVRLRKGGGGGF
jgi:hypothetical protein